MSSVYSILMTIYCISLVEENILKKVYCKFFLGIVEKKTQIPGKTGKLEEE
jgi:hypothetical protein